MHTVYNELVRPSHEIIDAFRALLREYSPSCLVADTHPRVGAIGGLNPVKREHKIAGPALTVNLPVDDLVDILPVLPKAQPGDIVVLACHGNLDLAMWGGLMTTLSQMAGIAGAIVDGAVRDVDEVRDLDFPIWYRGTMPRRCPGTATEAAEPVQVNVPLVIDGTDVEPGDIVVADENGVAIVPPAVAEEVLDGTRRLLAKENVIRDKINAGATLAELLAEFGQL
jgi:regulator of RNase E activity RraA